MSILLWAKLFPHRYVVSYLDNEALKSALIKAWSHSDDANRIIKLYVDEELKSSWKPWFGRVPTHSNPADAPSRLDTSGLEGAGVRKFSFDWNSVTEQLIASAHEDQMG